MRISLQANSLVSSPILTLNNVPLTITIRPANNLAGTFNFQMSSNALLKLLRYKTNLSAVALRTFRWNLQLSAKSRISAVTIKDDVLQEIGYFVD